MEIETYFYHIPWRVGETIPRIKIRKGLEAENVMFLKIFHFSTNLEIIVSLRRIMFLRKKKQGCDFQSFPT